jgi:peptide/nickel transport system substrate-binding protein
MRAAPWDIFQETMGNMDWALSRSQWDYKGKWQPDSYKKGMVVESWDLPDLATYIFHVRKDIHFAFDNASEASRLVNGRELTADDIAYTFNRFNGLAGYKPSVSKNAQMNALVSVTAQDKYTVVFKFSAPSVQYFDIIMDPVTSNAIVPHEVVEKYGDMNNWHRVVGSGAFILTDLVSGSSGTFTKNPNYWGHDERYPQNQLPYFDQVKLLIIPNDTTALAALRTGKIDAQDTISWDVAANLKKTNPNLMQDTQPNQGYGISFRIDTKPFTDIRVRQALTEAIDIPTIAKTYFGGSVPGVPIGMASTSWTGWYVPYAQWSQDLKDKYAYNPTAAKKLLADAGYPTGFSTNIIMAATYDQNLMEIYKSYFAAIGVNMDIKVYDLVSFNRLMTDHKYDQGICHNPLGQVSAPNRFLATYQTGSFTNYAIVSDPQYDAIVNNFYAATDTAKLQALAQQADLYALSNFFCVQGLPLVTYVIYQPWLRGYSGEAFGYWSKLSMARLWIDQNLKKSTEY